MWLRFILLTAICLPLFGADYPLYERWVDQPLIRVGLKKPTSTVELASPGTLLVLDGKTVVGTINPKGAFFVITNKKSAGSGQRWVQVRAGSETMLKKEKTTLASRYPDWNFEIHQATRRLKALRIGPFTSSRQANQARDIMIAAGINDAFVTLAQRKSRFQWVDGQFDKFDFDSQNLGLVRTNPENPIGFQGTSYRGILRLVKTGNRIRVINELPMETYLRGVVPTELGPKSFPKIEAIKAQAVAARTYAIKNKGRFAKRGYDICDSPACQAYEGTLNETRMSDQAIRETANLVIYHGDELIDALYTSTCGGNTDDVENVFPGRREPYLRAKSSYIADYPTWDLPRKPVARDRYEEVPEALAVDSLLYGFKTIPDFSGPLTAKALNQHLTSLKWILGSPPTLERTGEISYRQFWQHLAKLTFFRDTIKHQVKQQDLGILLRNYDLPRELGFLGALLIRYDLINRDMLKTFSRDETMPVKESLAYLLGLCRSLGPEPTWRRYRMEGFQNNALKLNRKGKPVSLNLGAIKHYVTEVDGSLEFVEAPKVEEWDRIYTLETPFSGILLKVKESGVVASVDRFSAFDSWIEKKDVKTLERRASRYVGKVRGIRDIRILTRSEAGRVTLMEFITDKGKIRVDGLNIRWSLGIRDNFFDMVPNYINGRLVHVTFLGRGWGHGVGMSQVGAFGLARMGWTFDEILKYYYTGVEIRPFEP